jgi:predicted O-methyltransferase YrrM
MLGSLVANGGCQDALLVVFCVGEPSTLAPIAQKYRALLIQCNPIRAIGVRVKSVLYSAARVVNADQFLCLDADMLVLQDLGPVFSMIKGCPDGAILVCREDNSQRFRSLGDAFERLYGGTPAESPVLFDERSEAYPLVVNSGLFAGSRGALVALDSQIRAMARPRDWMDGSRCRFAEQFIFNLALAQSGSGVELDPAYNLQLQRARVRMYYGAGRIHARWKEKDVAVVHFNGDGRNQHPNWRNLYARVPSPPVGPRGGDGYAQFLEALRAWVGLRGLGALCWSFFSELNGHSARIRDVSTLPLLAFLHYLIRSNGCVRVMETGTARGVSAACMASAVAHRPGARVVSFDTRHYPERDDLWAALPLAMRSCLEPRPVGSIEGMRTAIDNGESYQAALLDTIHTAEHVWAEFELASRLVCPGGLILVHDAIYDAGTVEGALARIQSAGYGVARLWTAEAGLAEDAKLGLAVIENRVHPYAPDPPTLATHDSSWKSIQQS